MVLGGPDRAQCVQGVKEMFTSGDGGAHFKNHKMVYFWSSFYPRFEKIVENHFLPAHHGFNLCDSHGGALKTKFIAEQSKRGAGFETAEEFVSLVNAAQRAGEFWNTTTAVCFREPAPDRVFDHFFSVFDINPRLLNKGDEGINASLCFRYPYHPPVSKIVPDELKETLFAQAIEVKDVGCFQLGLVLSARTSE